MHNDQIPIDPVSFETPKNICQFLCHDLYHEFPLHFLYFILQIRVLVSSTPYAIDVS